MNIDDVLKAHGIGGRKRNKYPRIYNIARLVNQPYSNLYCLSLSNSRYLYYQSNLGNLYKVSDKNVVAWSYVPTNKVQHSCFNRAAECIIGATSTSLVRVSSSGTEVWTVPISYVARNITCTDTHIYVMDSNGYIYKYTLSGGTLVWSATTIIPEKSYSPGLASFGVNSSGEVIWSGSYSLYCLQASGAALKWTVGSLYISRMFALSSNKVLIEQHEGLSLYNFSGTYQGYIPMPNFTNDDFYPTPIDSVNLVCNKLYVKGNGSYIYVFDLLTNVFLYALPGISGLQTITGGLAINDYEDLVVNAANEVGTYWYTYYY